MPRLVLLLLLFSSFALAQPTNATPQQYSEEGERALAAHRYADAEQAYEKLRQLLPGTAEVHARLGLIYFQEGKFEPAVPALRQALKLKPSLPNTDVLLGMSLSELGQFNEALPGLEKGFRKSSDPALKRMSGLQLQRAYTGLRKDAKAVEVALEMTTLYPNDPEVLYHAGKLFGNYAFLSIKKLADVAPDSVWRHQAAGELFESQEAYDLALNEYRQVASLDPRRPGTHFRIGRVLLARARHFNDEGIDDAVKEFEQELRFDHTNASAAYEVGEIDRKAGRFDSARQFFEQGIQYYPDFEDAHIGLGRTLIALGKPADALPHLNKAIALNPENAVTFYSLAQAYRALGKALEREKALAEFRRLRERTAARKTNTYQNEVTPQEVEPNAR